MRLCSAGLGYPESLCLEPVVLALGKDHEGLVSDGCKFAIKLVLVLMADVRLDVAGDNKVSLKKYANGVVNSCTPDSQL